jgi:hypothetical protein
MSGSVAHPAFARRTFGPLRGRAGLPIPCRATASGARHLARAKQHGDFRERSRM